MATEEEKREQEETEIGAHPVELPSTKRGRTAFSKVRRELSEEELASPAARRLLVDMVDGLEEELRTARQFQELFHRADKDAAILREKLKVKIAKDVMSAVALSSGFGLIGLVKNLWDKQPYAIIVLCLAIIMVLGGIAVKVITR